MPTLSTEDDVTRLSPGEDELLAAAASRLDGPAGKSRETLGAIKSTMFASVVRALHGSGAE